MFGSGIVAKKQESITDAELGVMHLLWEHGDLTAREIREQLYPKGGDSAHGTVQKLLQRLEKKKFVARDRSEFAHVFRAKVTEQAYAGGQLRFLADKLTGGSLVPFLTHLVESQGICKSELRELRKLFEEEAKLPKRKAD